jgi:hypothetical protein
MYTTSLDDDLNTFRISRGFPPQEGSEEKEEESPPDLGGAGEEPELAEETPVEPEIDLKTLAEKLYVLLRQELRLERERMVRQRRW